MTVEWLYLLLYQYLIRLINNRYFLHCCRWSIWPGVNCNVNFTASPHQLCMVLFTSFIPPHMLPYFFYLSYFCYENYRVNPDRNDYFSKFVKYWWKLISQPFLCKYFMLFSGSVKCNLDNSGFRLDLTL